MTMDFLFRFVLLMGKLILHINPNPKKLEEERAERFLNLPFEEKLHQLFTLIDLAIKMNGGKPFKQPQGKGLIIRKMVKE